MIFLSSKNIPKKKYDNFNGSISFVDGNILNLYSDNTIIISQFAHVMKTNIWKKTYKIKYLFTIDKCILPLYNKIHFHEDAKRSLQIKNAGGHSEISEALSMQYMSYMFDTTSFIPEMEVNYWFESKMCDFIMIYNNENIGVSVTRAYNYYDIENFTLDLAIKLLNKKLFGLIVARNSTSKKHRFFKSILHIWCFNQLASDNIKKAHHKIIETDIEKSYDDIYIICTICQSNFIYSNTYD